MRSCRILVAVAAAFALGGCTDEKLVYRDRPPFNPPRDSINGFLGYFTVSEKQTSCGNCHVGHQRDWKTSAHAGAWAGLQSAGPAVQGFCVGCHTVSERGNPAAAPAGYTRVADSAYHDVQCESCHGPGFEHASVPDVGAKPIARVAVEISDTGGTCGDCHQGAHHPFVEEWAQSRHAEAQPEVIANYASNPTTYASCLGCHEGRNVLKRFGVTAEYVERNDPVNANTALGITCAVCHDPHGSPNTAQLRFPLETADPQQNLCMQCHIRRTVPASGSSRGNTPHAPQGAVLLGEAGYQNPAYLDTALLNAASSMSHASLTRNPKLCAGCHVFRFDVSDPAQGFVQTVTGHLFRPIPCYDANGVPTDTIRNCAYTPTARSFKPCAASGCHASENDAANFLAVSRTRLQQLSRQLWVDADGDRTIDAFPADSGYLAKIKANTTDLNPTAAPVTAADGAEFNLRLVGEDAAGFLYDNGDKSHGVHNPFIAEALLRASIQELNDLYGSQPWWTPPSPEVQKILDGPLGVTGRVPFPRAVVRQTSLR
ncbi:MAG TPA: cytochrome c3 family protein [Gemmatimonadales bacterium]|nr:cytochrome c3 family protein [Gemmatimonadales bacterium]